MEFPRRSASKNCQTAPNLHEVSRFALYFFHRLVQFERAGIAFGQRFFEISAEAEVAPEEHVRIDVTPHFVQIRHGANFAIEIRDCRESANRCELRGERSSPAGSKRRGAAVLHSDRYTDVGVLLHHAFALARDRSVRSSGAGRSSRPSRSRRRCRTAARFSVA